MEDGWIERKARKKHDGSRRKENNKLQTGFKEGEFGVGGGRVCVRVCVGLFMCERAVL